MKPDVNEIRSISTFEAKPLPIADFRLSILLRLLESNRQLAIYNRKLLQRQTQPRLAAGRVLTILQRERAAVRLSNLAGKDQTNS